MTERIAAVLIALALATTPSVTPAAAGQPTGTFRCRMSATKLADRIEVTFRLRSWEAGQTWRIRLFDGRVRFLDRTRTTGPTGRLTVAGSTMNRPGRDEIRGIAREPVSGARCDVALSI